MAKSGNWTAPKLTSAFNAGALKNERVSNARKRLSEANADYKRKRKPIKGKEKDFPKDYQQDAKAAETARVARKKFNSENKRYRTGTAPPAGPQMRSRDNKSKK